MYEADLAAQMKATRETSAFLPGFRLRENVEPTSNLREALEGSEIVVGVMPSQHARAIYSAMLPNLKASSIIVSATKGLEKGSLLRMSQVIEQACQPRFKARVVVLSGPTFAREIAQGSRRRWLRAAPNWLWRGRSRARFPHKDSAFIRTRTRWE